MPGLAVTVTVPASSANLGPGFDSVAIGLDLRDRCTATISDRPGVRVSVSGEGAGAVPTDARHLVVRAMLRAWEVAGVAAPEGLDVVCVNAVPHGRGLGSSATAIVTGVGAAYGLMSARDGGGVADLGRIDHGVADLGAVNDLAADLEGHPDNSSASVFGGLTLSWADDAARAGGIPHTRTVRLDPHPTVRPVVFCPEVQLSTATARSVLPAHVLLRDAAANSARAALLVHALTAAPSLLLPATRDWLHQEARRPSYADSMALVDAFRAAGHAAVISGAGPSVLVLTSDVPAVTAYAPAGWAVLDPGFAADGLRVE